MALNLCLRQTPCRLLCEERPGTEGAGGGGQGGKVRVRGLLQQWRRAGALDQQSQLTLIIRSLLW